jgi:acetyl-CoA synthetase
MPNFSNSVNSNRKSLRLLGSVGEPINPQAWQWYYKYVGNEHCSIIDTWWQTETGAVMIAPIANFNINKPGCAMLPFYGINLELLDDNKNIISGQGQGNLVIKSPWPGMIKTVYKQPKRFIDTYFKSFNNYFYTGDLARRDSDGHYWLLGRNDDVINISGHRLGTAEIESALVSHEAVAEAAVVPIPDDIKGQGLYAFVTLKNSYANNNNFEKILIQHVKEVIGPIAVIATIKFTDSLPKTRSGKIMRRILKKIAVGENSNFGDLSTLADQNVIEKLL